MLERQSAWCVMLGIDRDDMPEFEQMYYEVLKNNPVQDD